MKILIALLVLCQAVAILTQYAAPLPVYPDNKPFPDIECIVKEDCNIVCDQLGIDTLEVACFRSKCWCRPGWHQQRNVNRPRNDPYDFD